MEIKVDEPFKSLLDSQEDLSGMVSKFAEIHHGFYYDTLTIPAGEQSETQFTLFQQPLSATKSWTLTNMLAAGRLVDPCHMQVKRLFFVQHPSTTEQDKAALLEVASFGLTIGWKSYGRGPLAMFPASGTLKQVREGARPDLVVDFVPGVHILQGQYFSVTVSLSKSICPVRPVRVMAFLEGPEARSVQ